MRQYQILIALGILIILAAGVFALRGGADTTPAPAATTTPERAVRSEPVRDVIGTSVEGRDIEAYTYGNGDTHLVFVGAIHGGYEWNTVILARTLMEHFDAHPEAIPEGVTVTVIPILNPDGLHRVLGTTGTFTEGMAPPKAQTTEGRFNARGVDLNRNFACNWQPESMWRGETVDAGVAAFSEPEAAAMRDFVRTHGLAATDKTSAVIFYHSAANGVYGASCNDDILPEGKKVMHTYAEAAGYPAIESFDYYEITGDAEGWLAKLGVPSVSVELTSHESIEWERNKKGVEALLRYYAKN